MRSCGVSRGKVSLLFLAEAGFLSVIGAAAGFVLALLVMQIISFIPISIDSVFSMLTTNGHFLWILSPTVICLKFLLTACLAILAALGPAIRAANMILRKRCGRASNQDIMKVPYDLNRKTHLEFIKRRI